jgi:ABC-type branched-subunit amino acid transport system ATPase component
VSEPILRAENLSRSFGGVQAVSGVTFDLMENQVLGVIGPNGAGKTTLINLLTGFVRPDQVLWVGSSPLSPMRAPQEIAYR